MSAFLIILRLIHISFGVFWGGALLFVNFLLGPSVTAVGPDGVKVMQELVHRKYFEVLILAGTLVLLSGFGLMWIDARNFGSGWFGTPMGQGISVGMLGALVAFLMGVFVIRPTLLAMLAIGAQLGSAPAEQRQALVGQMEATRGKLISSGKIATLALLVAILAMAVSRYL